MIASWCGLLALAGAVALWGRRDRRVAFAGLLALAGLFPTSNLIAAPFLQADRYTHMALVGVAYLVVAAVFCALLSTADSEILVASSAVVRDLYQQTVKKDLSSRTAMIMSRTIVLILGFAAMILALTEARAIFWFVLFSWAGLGASFGPALIMGLFWRRFNKWGAAAGVITGFVVTIVWKLYIRGVINRAFHIDIYELVPAFVMSLLMIYVVSKLTGADPEVEREFLEKVRRFPTS